MLSGNHQVTYSNSSTTGAALSAVYVQHSLKAHTNRTSISASELSSAAGNMSNEPGHEASQNNQPVVQFQNEEDKQTVGEGYKGRTHKCEVRNSCLVAQRKTLGREVVAWSIKEARCSFSP